MAEAQAITAAAGRQPINLICKTCTREFAFERRPGARGANPRYCSVCAPVRVRGEGTCKHCGAGIEKVGAHARSCCDTCKTQIARAREDRRNARKRAARPPKFCSDCSASVGTWKPGGNIIRCEGCAAKAHRAVRDRENAKRRRGEPLAAIMARVAERRARLKVELLERRAKRALDRATKPWMAPGLTDAQQYACRYQNDPEFRARERERAYRSERRKTKPLETALRYVLVRNGASSSKLELIGCTVDDLRQHIESQFRRGMTWEAFRAGRIHIAHVTRLSQFDLDEPDDVTKAWTLSNLRPMWARDNLRLCWQPVLGADD